MNNIITSPQLQSRSGYIEVIDENGNHVYQYTQETEEKLKLQSDLENAKLQLKQADDTAIDLYESQSNQDEFNKQQDDSIIAIYEKIGG